MNLTFDHQNNIVIKSNMLHVSVFVVLSVVFTPPVYLLRLNSGCVTIVSIVAINKNERACQ